MSTACFTGLSKAVGSREEVGGEVFHCLATVNSSVLAIVATIVLLSVTGTCDLITQCPNETQSARSSEHGSAGHSVCVTAATLTHRHLWREWCQWGVDLWTHI